MWLNDFVICSVFCLLLLKTAICRPQTKRHFKSKDTPNVSKLCLSDLLQCKKVNNYPADLINGLVKKRRRQNPAVLAPAEAPHHNLLLRTPSTENEPKNVCETTSLTIFPTVAEDENFNKRFIVNVDHYRQSLTYEKCVSSETSKNNVLNGLIMGPSYDFTCKQKYVTVDLLYLTENKRLKHGRFSVPSTCVLSYRTVESL